MQKNENNKNRFFQNNFDPLIVKQEQKIVGYDFVSLTVSEVPACRVN